MQKEGLIHSLFAFQFKLIFLSTFRKAVCWSGFYSSVLLDYKSAGLTNPGLAEAH